MEAEPAPDASQDEALAASRAVAELAGVLHAELVPTEFRVGASPEMGMVRITFVVKPDVEVTVLLRASEALKKLHEDIEACNLRAKSGLVVAKGGMKGVTGT